LYPPRRRLAITGAHLQAYIAHNPEGSAVDAFFFDVQSKHLTMID
jgi:hypothetical protein